ncbi:MAG: hypothetical protein AAFR47_16420 [Pseudomonadota bacterium]
MTSIAQPLLRRWFAALPDATTPRQPPKRRTGPVLMGDIHGSRNGVPMLLVLWAQWEAERNAED